MGFLTFLGFLYALIPIAIFFMVLGISGRMRQLEAALNSLNLSVSRLSSQMADLVLQRPSERSGMFAEEAPAPAPPSPPPARARTRAARTDGIEARAPTATAAAFRTGRSRT